MKVAVSIPDPVFDRAEQLATRLKLSRSKLYARALDAFVAEHDEKAWDVDAINAILDELGDEYRRESILISQAGARTVLKHSEW